MGVYGYCTSIDACGGGIARRNTIKTCVFLFGWVHASTDNVVLNIVQTAPCQGFRRFKRHGRQKAPPAKASLATSHPLTLALPCTPASLLIHSTSPQRLGT